MKTFNLKRIAKAMMILVVANFSVGTAQAQFSSGYYERVTRMREIRMKMANGSIFDTEVAKSYGPFLPDRDSEKAFAHYRTYVEAARCVSTKQADAVEAALSHEPNSAAGKAAFEGLKDEASVCDAQDVLKSGLRRGLLSEGAYLVAFPAAPALPSTVTADRLKAFRASEFDRNAGRTEGEKALIDVADCLVLSDLSLADRVARSNAGDEDEKALLDAMFVAAPYCAGEERPTDLSRSVLRAFLSEALYRASVNEATRDLFAPAG
ncbi:hypothetical protein [Sphingomicrobium nitratireducens]|uniref:hypothetical protein n=1 Tax=Sphingomicrobium nitratireducens TaxID=2964666 RepID=UPI00223FBBD3|nr:hypothetical protein [Sphingomicrobium nitratireducens]